MTIRVTIRPRSAEGYNVKDVMYKSGTTLSQDPKKMTLSVRGSRPGIELARTLINQTLARKGQPALLDGKVRSMNAALGVMRVVEVPVHVNMGQVLTMRVVRGLEADCGVQLDASSMMNQVDVSTCKWGLP